MAKLNQAKIRRIIQEELNNIFENDIYEEEDGDIPDELKDEIDDELDKLDPKELEDVALSVGADDAAVDIRKIRESIGDVRYDESVEMTGKDIALAALKRYYSRNNGKIMEYIRQRLNYVISESGEAAPAAPAAEKETFLQKAKKKVLSGYEGAKAHVGRHKGKYGFLAGAIAGAATTAAINAIKERRRKRRALAQQALAQQAAMMGQMNPNMAVMKPTMY